MIALTDETQGVRRVYAYDDWGNDAGTGGFLAAPNADRARCKGALWMGPELDLYYMRNRWYEPGTGRFLSEDPIGLGGGINPVVFAGGDPVNLRDPEGAEQECITVTVEVDGQLPEITVICPKPGGLPQEPTVPVPFPEPPCPECNTPRDPMGPGGRRAGPNRPPSTPQPEPCPAGFQSPRPGARITSPFDPQRLHPVLRVVRPHRGIDFSGRIGAPVLAAARGNVSSRVSSSFGNVIVIAHADKFTTVYAHLSSFAVASGNVAAGDTIGFVGQSGLVSGPHLHFELRLDGQAIDPMRCLQ